MSRIEARKFIEQVRVNLPSLVTLSAVGSIIFGTHVASAAPEQQIDPNTNCPVGETPHFVLGFAALKNVIGDAMGDPLECEHGRPDNKDTNQKTTRGLAYWRESINAKSFTDGYKHWAEQNGIIVTWQGQDIEAPADATPVQKAETAAASSSELKMEFTRENQKFAIKLDTNNPNLPLNFNPDATNLLQDTLAKDGKNSGYHNLNVITLTSIDDLPSDVNRSLVSPINVRKNQDNPSMGLDNVMVAGSIASFVKGDELFYYIIPNNILLSDDPRTLQEATKIYNYFLVSSILHAGDWSAPNALFQQSEHIQLASQNPIVLTSLSIAALP